MDDSQHLWFALAFLITLAWAGFAFLWNRFLCPLPWKWVVRRSWYLVLAVIVFWISLTALTGLLP